MPRKPLILLALLWAGACQRATAPRAAIAHLEHLLPAVSVRGAGGEGELAAQDGQALQVGDVVATSGRGEVDVVFAGNNRIHLGPEASLLVERDGGANAELGAVVLAGNARVTAGGVGVPLGVRSPVGRAHLSGAKVSVLDVSMQGGLEVKLGEVSLVEPKAEKAIHLEVGQAVTMATAAGGEGIVVSSVAPAADLAPMTFDVAAPPYATARRRQGASRLRLRGSGDWQSLRRPTRLGNGDIVRTAGDARAEVALGNGRRVELMGDGQLQLLKREVLPRGDDISYRLEGPRARLSVRRSRRLARQHVVTPAAAFEVGVGPQRADVEVAQRANATEVLVRFGSVTLASGDQIHAGQRAVLNGGKLVAAATEAFDGSVQVADDRPSVVYYDHHVPAVRFAPGKAKAGDSVRFARDRRVRRGAYEERLHGGAFVTDAVAAGRTYWRTGARGRVLALDLVKEPHRAQATRGGATQLDDNGQPTTIFFGNAVPRVQLNWPRDRQADHYRVELWTQGSGGRRPLRSRNTRATTWVVPRGLLREGDYGWRAVPIAAGGRPLLAGQDNAVSLVHDAEVHGLALASPVGGRRTTDATVLAQGDLERGCKLTVNGQPLAADRKSHFSQVLPLAVGDNHFHFCLSKAGRPDRWYTRTITRDP